VKGQLNLKKKIDLISGLLLVGFVCSRKKKKADPKNTGLPVFYLGKVRLFCLKNTKQFTLLSTAQGQIEEEEGKK
jgi:hypothetical protein